MNLSTIWSCFYEKHDQAHIIHNKFANFEKFSDVKQSYVVGKR